MPNNASDIILSPATIYFAPVGETLPDETTVEYGDAWGGNWAQLGYTLAPLAVGYSREEYEVEVEQITLPIKRIKTKESVTLETTLAEVTAANLQLAIGGTVTTTAAGAGQRAFEELKAGGDTVLDEYAWGIEGLHQDAAGNRFPARLVIYKGTATLNGQLEFSKKKESGLPLQIKALADTGKAVGQQLLSFQRVTAEATS